MRSIWSLTVLAVRKIFMFASRYLRRPRRATSRLGTRRCCRCPPRSRCRSCRHAARQSTCRWPAPGRCLPSRARRTFRPDEIVQKSRGGEPAGTPRPRSVMRNSTQLAPNPTPIVTTPPGGENFRAFDRRLTTTWTIRSASAQISVRDLGRLDDDAVLTPERGQGLHRAAQDRPDRDVREPQLDLAGLEPFEIEDVVDERHQPDRVALGDGHDLHRFAGQRANGPRGQQAERPSDRGQRRAQLVARRRRETRCSAARLPSAARPSPPAPCCCSSFRCAAAALPACCRRASAPRPD